jgi:hypothetical protein
MRPALLVVACDYPDQYSNLHNRARILENDETPMKGTLRRQSLCLGTVGASGASYILQDAQCHLLWPGH